MNRLALAIGAFMLVLVACAPQAEVQNNVGPWLISATPLEESVVLQGRYFGDGQAGEAQNSYVVMGANANGRGGFRAPVVSWTDSRIEVARPQSGQRYGYGFAFVYVDGTPSTGLPVNLD